ncbi:hypothetical protein MC885_013136, partial [Smutsia gigantea]
MVNEYKKILLLKGLKHIDDFHFSMIKSLLAPDLKLTTKTQQEYDRIKIADLMEVKFRGAACVDKLIELLQDIEIYKDLAKTLKNETLKVAQKMRPKAIPPQERRFQEKTGPAAPTSSTNNALRAEKPVKAPVAQKRKKTMEEKTGTKRSKVSLEQAEPPRPSEASTSTSTGSRPPPQTSSSAPSSTSLTESQIMQTQRQVAARGKILQKDPLTVMVLKTTKPFKYESPEKGKSAMFHATVATSSQFFQVKVLNTDLKDKFTKKKVITISCYFECKGILEINEASSVSEAGIDQQAEVPNRIIKRANETPKIDNLYKQASGTLVYGLFMLHKKRVNVKNTIYEIQDNTGKMDVVGKGKWHNIRCKEGDKLRLFCFQLRTIDQKLKLTCGNHSFIQ